MVEQRTSEQEIKRYRVHGTLIDDYSHTQTTVEMVIASDYDSLKQDLYERLARASIGSSAGLLILYALIHWLG